jgi:hypothetical protein
VKAWSGLAVHTAEQVCSLAGGNRVANGDLAISENVGVEPAAVDEFLDDPCPCHLLQMLARLAQFDAETLDIPDSKAPANQLVEPHTPHDHLTARLSAGQADVLQCFGLDQRQRLAGFCAPPAEVAVAAESLARQCADRLDRREGLAWAGVDRFDVHEPIMAVSAATANCLLADSLHLPDDIKAIESTASAAYGERFWLGLLRLGRGSDEVMAEADERPLCLD